MTSSTSMMTSSLADQSRATYHIENMDCPTEEGLIDEGIPGHDGLNGGEWVAARLFGVNQHLADASAQARLGIDRHAGRLELLLMLVLGSIKQLAHNALVQVDDFVGDGGHALDNLARSAGVIWPPSRAILSRRFW